ncbi:cell wall-binding protein [Methylomonas sp. AM2-LC]|uniref:cell wall-binding protein n=1 Tax=Methylomonas sp. AM2-LC TaxID=3153301 RepID=UPI003265B8DA
MSDNNENKRVLAVVNSAKKAPSKVKGSKSSGDGTEKNEGLRFGQYQIINNAFNRIKTKEGGIEITIPLCNFTCKILEEIFFDSGLSDEIKLKIEGIRQDGKPLSAFDIPLNRFTSSQGGWQNDAWGMLPRIATGSTVKESLRDCVHHYSQLNGDIPRRTVYKYMGWKKINDKWHYLTPTGAITESGLINSIKVDLGTGHMGLYGLPAPLTGEPLKQAVNDALMLLKVCPNKQHIGIALLAAIARAPLGECLHTDFALWLHGKSGSRKSALAFIAQGFFGKFEDKGFPANWGDTGTDIEAKAYQAKDAFYVIDDYKPIGGERDVKALEKIADRIIRGTGNQSGRGRRGAGMEEMAAYYNRSMTLITGEDVAPGQSLIGRLLVLEMSPGDIDLSILNKMQDASRAEKLSGLISAYVQWLAPKYDQLKLDLPVIVKQYRDAADRDKIATSHSRAPTIYANMVASSEIFLEFLEDIGVISSEQSNNLLSNFEISLQGLLKEQNSYQADQDECNRFIELLRAALSGGNAHISDSKTQEEPATRPHSFGWINMGIGDDKVYQPKGDLIGWYVAPKNNRPSKIFLQKDMAYQAAQRCATTQKQTFHSGSMASLWRLLLNKGWIEPDNSEGKPRPDPKKRIDGVYHRVLVLREDVLFPPAPVVKDSEDDD